MSILLMRGLWKSFGEQPLLNIESLTLNCGKSYALIGENGSGKTTLLRIMAGLEPATLRSYCLEGQSISVSDFPGWARRKVIYVHQHPYIFHTSVKANIAFGLKMRGLGRRAIEQSVREAMEWAGIAHLADIPPAKLSGGEKQRLALARAKVLNPQLLLLDEPTANLDAEAREQMTTLIQRLCQENNCVVFATHDKELITHADIKLHLANARVTSIQRPWRSTTIERASTGTGWPAR